eukprot:TRINITY_DN12834_c0_g1_i1.p1 TRINITY_DN12834_c0_g1~~TRINITY_DN12834_c0_g1_i1.p1  ORF type:complete len:365 (+),score=37.48 TRINITY_DN12834_c0_g1_i1:90-1184(+)
MFFFSQNENINPNNASFFEMRFQDNIITTLKPALLYCFSVFAVRNPFLDPVVRNFDEIYAFSHLLIEQYCLNNYDGSLMEVYFSLQRRRKMPDGNFSSLTPKLRFWSLFFLVILPYIKGKLDNYYKQRTNHGASFANLSQETTQTSISSSPSTTLRVTELAEKSFLTCYPYLHAVFEGTKTLYQLLFINNLTDYYSPFYHILHLQVHRLSFDDLDEQERQIDYARRDAYRKLRGRGLALWIARFSLRLSHVLIDNARPLLLLLWMLYKFLEWWYSNEETIFPSLQMPIPPPPEPPIPFPTGVGVPSDKRICPLCCIVRSNPAFIASSGHVFCYPCIHNYVQRHQRCPITFVSTSEDEIHKLYDA